MQGGLLTNVEVHMLLKEQKKHRIQKEISDPAVEFFHGTVSRYVESCVSKEQNTLEEVRKLIKLLDNEKLGLTEAETMQLLNACPKYQVEVHTIIEECAERLSEEQIDRIIEIFTAAS
jgi:DNA-directed RNA polymerase subunit F